ERLDADAEERRQGAEGEAARDLRAGGDRVVVLLVVGAIAVAVLEVDPEVLDRLAPELLDDALVHLVGEVRRDTDRLRELAGRRRGLVQDAQRDVAELARRLRGE